MEQIEGYKLKINAVWWQRTPIQPTTHLHTEKQFWMYIIG
jgi:hypothetical protein